MKLKLALFTAIAFFASFAADTETFNGRILYKSTFTDLKGNDITAQVAPIMGNEQHYYIDGKNYKMLTEKDNLIQLYQADKGAYYEFQPGKIGKTIDATNDEAKKVTITKLDKKEKILSYECRAIKIEADEVTTIYYYSPTIKVDPMEFTTHAYGQFNQYLKATDGALPLKFEMTDKKNGFVWKTIAINVTKMKLTDKDFELPSDYQIK